MAVMPARAPNQAAPRKMPVVAIVTHQRSDPLRLGRPHMHATAANSPKPLRAPDAIAISGKAADPLVHDAHAGAAALAGSPVPPPSRRRSLLALKASRATHKGHRGGLPATDLAQCRCRLPPSRPACRCSSNRSFCYRHGNCHRCSDKTAACLLAAAHDQRL